MSQDPAPQARWRSIATGIAVLAYAVAVFIAARAIGHRVFSGWPARLATLALIAVGMLPCAGWLRSRLPRWMGLIGRAALVGCYFTLLLPFAIIMRLAGDRFHVRRPAAGPQWLPRRPLPNTLEAARGEY